jgi:hypothetical protein
MGFRKITAGPTGWKPLISVEKRRGPISISGAGVREDWKMASMLMGREGESGGRRRGGGRCRGGEQRVGDALGSGMVRRWAQRRAMEAGCGMRDGNDGVARAEPRSKRRLGTEEAAVYHEHDRGNYDKDDADEEGAPRPGDVTVSHPVVGEAAAGLHGTCAEEIAEDGTEEKERDSD